MSSLASASPVRPEWIYQLNQELQVFAGLVADGPLGPEELARVLERLPKPDNGFEDIVIRGTHALMTDRNEAAARSSYRQSGRRFAGEPVATTGKHEPCARAARAILEERFNENWTLKRLAHEVGCNRTVLEDAFKRLTGETIHPFLVERRMEVAKRLLGQADTKVSQVHADVGYRSRSAFYRRFTQLTGVRPREYLRNRPAE